MAQPKIGIIILAAGASSRMGEAKQLLTVGKTTLIEHIIGIAQSTDNESITVVLGANHEPINDIIENLDITIAYNEYWATGMGSSIRCGLQSCMQKHSDLNAVMVLLCDQYFITKKLLVEFVETYSSSQNGKNIIVSAQYGNQLGVPTLFDATLFPELLALREQQGAKKIIKKYVALDKVSPIPFPLGLYDMDTPEDYKRIVEMLGKS